MIKPFLIFLAIFGAPFRLIESWMRRVKPGHNERRKHNERSNDDA